MFEKMKQSFAKKTKQDNETFLKNEEEVKLVTDMYNKFISARTHKQDKTDLWKKCIDAYNSKYFEDAAKPDYKSDQMSNFIFSTIETIKPIMVDNDPKIITLPKTPSGMQVADKIQNLFDSEWQRAKMGSKLCQAITISLQMGTAVFGVFWDGKDENGLGNVDPILINPFNIFPDPLATTISNSEYIIYAKYIHVNKLKQKYPDKAEKITASSINYEELINYNELNSNVSNQVLVLECYVRDYTTEDSEKEIDGEKKKIKKSKYPSGRIITVAPELSLLLSDKQNPYGEFPFFLLKCYDIPFEFWGKGEIEQILSPQTYINELTNQIIDTAKLTANMPWVLDKNSGIGKGQLTNRPGLIIRKNPGTAVDRLPAPQLPNYIAEMVDVLKRDIEVITGIHDVTQGRKPGSISAASAIMALQEAAQARIRLKVKLMEYTLNELGLCWYNRIQKFWKTNRFVRVFNKMDAVEFVEITPDDLQVNIDFMIVSGSTMPQNKNAMLDLMIRLAQTPGEDGLPMVDRDTVLAYTNVPDRKKIVQKFTELVQGKQVQAEQQQQLMMQQQQAQQEMQLQNEMTKEMMKHENNAKLEEQRHSQNLQSKDMTDEQLNTIIQLLIENPELLQQINATVGSV